MNEGLFLNRQNMGWVKQRGQRRQPHNTEEKVYNTLYDVQLYIKVPVTLPSLRFNLNSMFMNE